MTAVYWLIWGATALAAATAVAALAWAVEAGQMRDLGKAARSIFDAAEPEGLVTDAFPPEGGRRRRAEPAGGSSR